MKPFFHPNLDQVTLTGVLYALGDPVRLKIVQMLAAGGEFPCSAFGCDLAKSTVSHHFKILREAGVIFSRKSGTQHLNSLRREELDSLFPGVLDSVLANCERTQPAELV